MSSIVRQGSSLKAVQTAATILYVCFQRDVVEMDMEHELTSNRHH